MSLAESKVGLNKINFLWSELPLNFIRARRSLGKKSKQNQTFAKGHILERSRLLKKEPKIIDTKKNVSRPDLPLYIYICSIAARYNPFFILH